MDRFHAVSGCQILEIDIWSQRFGKAEALIDIPCMMQFMESTEYGIHLIISLRLIKS